MKRFNQYRVVGWVVLMISLVSLSAGAVLAQNGPSFEVPVDQSYARNEVITDLVISITDMGTDAGRTASASGLPDGLSESFDSSTDTLTISGTVALAKADSSDIAGDSQVTISADDNLGNADSVAADNFTITVGSGISVTPGSATDVFDSTGTLGNVFDGTGNLQTGVNDHDVLWFMDGNLHRCGENLPLISH